ncbi:hypothetical protein [Streptomyces sp. ISL-94]|uniref:hypothetical protein n=1 Tax=Streptomyces sp. ISL-94 TaxID=2819190 RepID=UPI001BEB4383|nr:hypothetical protein [Streptomyces sp. ISL-94]MBT2480802.1 hypothetical protein [Streptomyces sp. ISL-94]
MPAHIHHDPLRVEFVFPDGSRYVTAFDTLPNQPLVAELIAGFPELVHPHGTIAARGTAAQYATGLRRMVRWLADEGFTGGMSDLTRPLLLRYWLAASIYRADMARALLRAAHQTSGTLAPDVVRFLNGRPNKVRPKTTPLQPYTEAEWQRITDALRSVVRQSWADHQRAVAAAEAGQDPRGGGVTPANVAHELMEYGPMSTRALTASVGCTRFSVEQVGRAQIQDALYPSGKIAAAYRMLLGVYTGVVPDGIAGLGLGDVTWSGDASVLLDYIKGRRGPESVNLTGRPVRLIERWLEHSALLRRHADEDVREELWLRLRQPSGRERRTSGYTISGPAKFKVNQSAQKSGLAAQLGLVDDSGKPLLLHMSRIRTTYVNTLSRKGWTGNTAIDPNHTTAVEGDRYLTAQTPAQMDAVETIIEESQSDLLRRALPPVVLTLEAAARAAVDLPAVAADLGVSDGALAELLGGERDVFTASCKDQLAGLHGPAGKPCPARPWVCLLCPLAVFMPRHAPNLLRLHASSRGSTGR